MDVHANKTSKELLRNANRLNSKLQATLQQETKTIDRMVGFIQKERREIAHTRKAIAAEITTGRRAHVLSRIGDHCSPYDSDSDQEEASLCKVSLALQHSKHLFNKVLDKASGFCVARSQMISNGNLNELGRGSGTANYGLPLIMLTDNAQTLPADLSGQEEIDVSEKVRRYIEQLEPHITTSEIKSESREEVNREYSPEDRSEATTEVGSELSPEVGSEFKPEVRSEFRPEVGSEFRPEIGSDGISSNIITSFSGSGVKPQIAPNKGKCKDTLQQDRRRSFGSLAQNKMVAGMNNDNLQKTVNNYNLSPRNSDLSKESSSQLLQERSSPLQHTKIRHRRHSVLGIAFNIPITSEPMLSKRRSGTIAAIVEKNPSTEIHLNYGQEKRRSDSGRADKRLSKSQNFTEKIINSKGFVKAKTHRSFSDDTRFRKKSQVEGSHTPDINLSRKLNVPRHLTRRYSLPRIPTLAGSSESLVGDVSRKLQRSIVLEDVSSEDEVFASF